MAGNKLNHSDKLVILSITQTLIRIGQDPHRLFLTSSEYQVILQSDQRQQNHKERKTKKKKGNQTKT